MEERHSNLLVNLPEGLLLRRRIMEIDNIDQQIITCAVSGLPPVLWYWQCQTDDQKQHWEHTRQNFQGIYVKLKSFFTGIDIDTNINIDVEDDAELAQLIEIREEIYRLGANRYIHLYQVIYNAWDELNKASKLINFPLPESHGKLLVHCIELECASMFSQCQNYTEVNPRKLYDLYLKAPKIDKILANQKVIAPDRLKVINYQSQINRLDKDFGRFYNCLKFIIDVAKKSKVKRIQQSLRIYFETCDMLDEFINTKFNHARKGKTGEGKYVPTTHQWNKGKVKKLLNNHVQREKNLEIQ